MSKLKPLALILTLSFGLTVLCGSDFGCGGPIVATPNPESTPANDPEEKESDDDDDNKGEGKKKGESENDKKSDEVDAEKSKKSPKEKELPKAKRGDS